MDVLTVAFYTLPALIASGALLVALRSAPERLRRSLAETLSRVGECEGTCDDLKAAWARARTGLEALQEEIDANLERVEKRRRRAHASEQRAKSNGDTFTGGTGSKLDQFKAKARAMGLPG